MTIEAGLHGHLAGSPAVAAAAPGGVHPVILPQEAALPAITYQRISTQSQQSLSGGSGFARVRFQVDCWAKTYAATAAMGEAVRLAMQGFSGVMGRVRVQGVIMLDRQDSFDPATKTYRNRMDFSIWHEEQKP